jgi:galactose mutarotase-like enzyme
LKDGLLRAEPEAIPVKAKRLALSEGLFKEDAIIFDQLESRAVRYAAENGPSIELSWEGFRELGTWSKPAGAPFLCIEPWYGFASPSNFDGEFVQKPGLMYVAPTEKRTLKYCISVG